ncbi:MAG: type II toxin-antitoxin system RelE/ParE family toxin [Proteobacteria bacterium]|nr:type II toxin-antitoxin system RelE/ParE family toxin [Pseudomonadota bacterium]MBU1736733.1 type II toxin-antitoxin system RelE/ParE family toxin [Pseudomonadota bacterium]
MACKLGLGRRIGAATMQIRWEEEALSDLINIRVYIEEENPMAAGKLAGRIIDKVKLLADQPLLGSQGRLHNTRELVITSTPYTIIYHASADLITILRVFHQARKWPKTMP